MATLDELRSELGEAESRLREIDSEFPGQQLPDEKRAEWNTLNEEVESKKQLIGELEARQSRVQELSGQSDAREAGFNIAPERTRGKDIYDLSTIRSSMASPESAAQEMRDRAKEAIERGDYRADSISTEDAQSNALRILERLDGDDARISRRILATGSPTYRRAFGKSLTQQPLTTEEAKALAAGSERALSTTDAAGGYAIPFTLDPSVIHTSDHSVNPFRAVSRVVQVSGDNWNGVTSAGVSAAYAAEGAEAGDNAPTLAQPSIAVEKAHCFVPYSIEIGQDWGGLQTEITGMIQEAKDDLEATKFALGAGSGSDEPEGVLVGGTVTYTTASSATLAVGDIYGVESALPPRHRPRASWVANRAQYNRVRQFDTAGGAQLWTDNLRAGLNNEVPTPGRLGQDLLGYPTYELSTMGTTTAASSTIAIFGNFSRYVIVDRVGMSVELIPHLFHTGNNRPSGSRGIYAFWRNSAEVVDANAFRKVIAKAS